jgi:formylglycine-generating enzyme required for sulfatase activity
MKKVSRIKKLVVAATLLFVVGAEMQAQEEMRMIVYRKDKTISHMYTDDIDSVIFVKGETVIPCPTCPPCGGGGGGTSDHIFPIPDVSKFEMVRVQGGTMDIRGTNVTISDFYIGKYEVTQGLWEYVMNYAGTINGTTLTKKTPVYPGATPSATYGKGPTYPVYYVSWYDIDTIFLPRLNKITGMTFRLPREAEWEYAARGGRYSKGYTYSGSDNIGDVAWYDGNSGDNGGTSSRRAHFVGTKTANELGLHDMTGNVWEWCNDWYGTPYPSGTNNPTGVASGSNRVMRGGGWNYNAADCTIPTRYNFIPNNRSARDSFRLVLVP